MKQRRLARLAGLRKRIRDQQSASVAEAQDKLTAGESAHEAARAERLAFEAEARRSVQGARRVDDIWWLQRRAELYQAHEAKAAEQVEELKQLTDIERSKLRDLTKDVRVAELVLERLKVANVAEEARREQRMVDDIVATEAGGLSR